MSSYRRRPSDGSAEATGCVIALLTFGFFILAKPLYNRFRYHPPPYTPVAPHRAEEARIPYRLKIGISVALLFGLGFVALGFDLLSREGSRNRVGGFLTAMAIGAAGLLVGGFLYRRAVTAQHHQLARATRGLLPSTPTVYSISLPRAEANLNGGIHLLEALLDIHAHLAFQIVADGLQTVWQVVDPQGSLNPETLITAIRSHFPTAVVDRLTPTDRPPTTVYQQQRLFRLANEYPAPLPSLDRLKTDDPLIPLCQRLEFLNPEWNERVVYTLLVVTASQLARVRAWERLKEGNIIPLAAVPSGRKVDNLHSLDEQLLNSKLAQRLYHTFLIVTLESTRQSRLEELAGIETAIQSFGIPQHNHLVPAHRSSPSQVSPQPNPLSQVTDWVYGGAVTASTAPWRAHLLVLSPGELAALWHLPDERFSAERIAWASSPIPSAVTQTGSDRVILGTTVGRGATKPVTLSLLERGHHVYIAGKTGVGKSTLLHNLIHQDIQAGRGSPSSIRMAS
jgi:hypothetical protein